MYPRCWVHSVFSLGASETRRQGHSIPHFTHLSHKELCHLWCNFYLFYYFFLSHVLKFFVLKLFFQSNPYIFSFQINAKAFLHSYWNFPCTRSLDS